MKKAIFSQLRLHTNMDPFTVDRQLISAFLRINNFVAIKNTYISKYIIGVKDEEELLLNDKITNLIHSSSVNFNFEQLIELFEFVVSPKDKIVTGAVYTPKLIRDYIILNAFENIGNSYVDLKIADLASGCGSFLFDAAIALHERFHLPYYEIFRNNIYGLDIQEYSIRRSKLLLILLAITNGEDLANFDFNLNVGDALSFDWSGSIEDFNGFNIILGNPPYVCSRNINNETRQFLGNWEVCSSGHPDLYIPFFQIGIENLIKNGFLGFITMNTFFKSVNGRALREYFQKKSYKFKIIDFNSHQIFNSKSTYTCICFIEKTFSESLEYKQLPPKDLLRKSSYNKINYNALIAKKGWNLNKNELINRIESVGIPLSEKFRTRNGIATLKNNIYIFSPVSESDNYYSLLNDKLYQIEKSICMDIINPNRFVNVADPKLITQKIIFPYFFKNGKATLIDEPEFRLKYPMTYQYLSQKKDILSTRDKGNGKYEAWYAYGRNQSLEKVKNKLFFPHISPNTPNFILNTDDNLLFYNGLAAIHDDKRELLFLQKLLTTKLFWYYIRNSSKPYGSGYYSLSRNYIKNFGIIELSNYEKDFIINLTDKEELDRFIEDKYEIEIP